MAIECIPYFPRYKLQRSISCTSKIEHVNCFTFSAVYVSRMLINVLYTSNYSSLVCKAGKGISLPMKKRDINWIAQFVGTMFSIHYYLPFPDAAVSLAQNLALS